MQKKIHYAITQIPSNETAITATLSHHSVFKMYTRQLLYILRELSFFLHCELIYYSWHCLCCKLCHLNIMDVWRCSFVLAKYHIVTYTMIFYKYHIVFKICVLPGSTVLQGLIVGIKIIIIKSSRVESSNWSCDWASLQPKTKMCVESKLWKLIDQSRCIFVD